MKKSHFIVQGIILSGLLLMPAMGWSQCTPLKIDLGNDTVLCEGDAMIIDAGAADSYNWQDNSHDRYLSVTSAGVYAVVATNDCSSDTDTLIVTQAQLPDFTLNRPVGDYFCKGETVEIEAGNLSPLTGLTFDWSVSTESETRATVDTTTNLSLLVTDLNGCKRQKEINIEFQYPYEMEKVLLATYNTASDRNMIIWSRTQGKRTDTYSVFNGVTESNLLRDVAFTETNMIIDESTNPHTKAAFYNLRVKDSCQNTSQLKLENGHRTMFLETAINLGQNILQWSRYQGFDFDYYYIYRGESGDNMALIDSLANDRIIDNMKYVDLTGKTDQLYYYQIAVKTPEPVYYDIHDGKKSNGGPFAHSLSNLEDNKLKTPVTAYIDPYIRVFPNPFTEVAQVRYTIRKDTHVRIDIYNLSGKHVITLLQEKQSPGTHTIPVRASELGMVAGIYFITVNVEEAGNFTLKLIQQ